jgi:hypothetical protein
MLLVYLGHKLVPNCLVGWGERPASVDWRCSRDILEGDSIYAPAYCLPYHEGGWSLYSSCWVGDLDEDTAVLFRLRQRVGAGSSRVEGSVTAPCRLALRFLGLSLRPPRSGGLSVGCPGCCG